MHDESKPAAPIPPDGARNRADAIADEAARDPIASAPLQPEPPAASQPPSATTGNRLAMLSETVLPALVLGGLAYASWVIVVPFLAALTWAVMVAYATYPVYERLRALMGGRGTLAAATMTLLSAIVLFAPLVWGAYAAQQEAGALIAAVRKFLAAPPVIPQWIERLPGVGSWLAHLRTDWLSQPDVVTAEMTEWLKARTGDMASIVGQIGKNLGKMLIALVAMFFVYRDWERIVAQVRTVFARFLAERVDDYLVAIGTTTRAVVYGLLVTAFIQGALAGAGYAVAGAPAPVLLGFITAVLALIPFATPLAWGSVGLWLLSNGETAAGIGILIWGALVVSQIDNVIRPIVISAQSDVPFLVVLIGVLGGVIAFGLIGLFIGPIVLAILLAVWREWAEEMEDG
jgi:predicted PurR-regulated permease PerM